MIHFLNKSVVLMLLFYGIIIDLKTSGYGNNPVHYRNDSIVVITGHVLDTLTLKGIDSANIYFEELPYGSFVEIVRSRANDGFFEFVTFGHASYRIRIQAYGFQAVVDTLYPIMNGHDGFLVKNYVLSREPSEEVLTLENLIFDLGKSEIKPESFNELDNLVNLMIENPDMVIQLEGHTDFRGGKSKNQKLSEDRVMQVKSYLIRGGILPDRILTKAFGGSKPLSWESSEEASRLNRRVEVRIIKR
jgi:outer membrane protein OmpA-like peptidoglycan-associated protein